MIIPDTAYQLAVVLVLVVPGIVFAATARWWSGPTPEDRDFSVRLARAIAISVVLDGLYAVALGPFIVHFARQKPQFGGGPSGFATDPRLAALLALVLLVVVPVMFGLCLQIRRRPVATRDHWWEFACLVGKHQATPSGWDRAAPKLGACFVRVFTVDGVWVGGWVGANAYVSTYPEPRDIFIDVEWHLNDDGSFDRPVDGTLGLYVPLSGGDRVAWLSAPAENAAPHDESSH